MILELMDWENTKVQFDIGDINDVFVININVVTGDEIAAVVYKDGQTEIFDSSSNRLMDFDDGGYQLYGPECELIFQDKWKNRKTSYSLFRGD